MKIPPAWPLAAFATALLPLACAAQGAAAPAAAASAPIPVDETQRLLLPTLKLPELTDVRLPLSGPVKAANTVLGLARQRLALVVGIGSLDGKTAVLDAASRDTRAVAAALRAAGFVVMVREDLGAEELRANLKEFRQRLQPAGLGFLYVTGVGIQVDGGNLVLARGARLDGQPAPEALKAAGVPLQELVDAVQGTADSPRYLVVDAAFALPALEALPARGLSAPKLPPGVLALYASAPGSAIVPPGADALPTPAPTDPRLIAASPFGRELVRSLTTPRLAGPEVLRLARSGTIEASHGRQVPFLDGDTHDKDEFAEPNLLDAVLPRSPEDLAREGLRAALRGGASRAGEMPVSAFTTPPPAAPVAEQEDLAQRPNAQPGSQLRRVGSTLADAAQVATGVAGAAATAAVVANAAGSSATAVADAAGAAGRAASTLSGGGAPVAPPAPAGLEKPMSAAAPKPAAAPAPTPAAVPAAPPVVATAPGPVAGPVALPEATPRVAPGLATAVSQALAGDDRTRAQRDGGERPAYVPHKNPFGYAEGDTYAYRVVDTWKDQVVGAMVQTIDEVLPSGELVVNGAQTRLDPQGRVTSTQTPDGARSEFEPAQELFWSNPKRGESRKVDFREFFQRADRSSGQTEWKGSASVGRPRTIELPAGEFEVVPIEVSGWFYEKVTHGALTSGQWSRTVWYSTKLGHPVAIDIEDADRLGKLLRRQRIELTDVQTWRGP